MDNYFNIKKWKWSRKELYKYNNIWRDKYSNSNIVGDNSWLFYKILPKDKKSFYNAYISEEYQTGNIRYSGRTIEQLREIAESFKQDCNDTNHTVNDFINLILCHVIYETFNGKWAEKQIVDYMNRTTRYQCDTIDGGELDSKYGIDVICKENEEVKFYLQIKPHTFYIGKCNNNVSLLKDRRNAFDKIDITFDRFGKPTYHVIYELNEIDDGNKNEYKWLNINNNLIFDLNSVLYKDTCFPKIYLGKINRVKLFN